MPTVEVVAELLIVGLFVIIGVAPWLDIFAPSLRKRPGLFPFKMPTDNVVGAALLFSGACYMTGVVANVLIDEVADSVGIIDFGADERVALEKDLARRKGKPETFKAAEHVLRERSDAMRDWLDARRSYVRIERGLAASAFLFLLALLVRDGRQLLGKRRKDPGARASGLPWRQPAAAFLVLMLAVLAWRAQENKYAKYVRRFTLEMPAPRGS